MEPAHANATPTYLGPYRIVERIGEGGMGVVDLGVGTDGGLVAIKSLRPWVVGGADGRVRFEREVAAMQRVRGSRVAEVLDADLTADPPYVVTRYVRGTPLSKVVRDHGPLKGEALHRLAAGLVEAIASVHAAGIVHRDVKPANVLLTDVGPVLIDFGLAHASDETRLTSAGSVAGTPGYLSPETARGQSVTFASDVHSWAATVAFAATGRSPYGTGPDAVVLDRIRRGEHDTRGIPEMLADTVTSALRVDPSSRPALAELARALGVSGFSAAASVSSLSEAKTVVSPSPESDDVSTAIMGETTTQRPLRQPEAARLRPWQPRLVVGLGAAVLVLLGAVWPYVGGLALIVLILVGRTTWRVRRRLHSRRTERGVRKSDNVVATLTLPMDIGVSLVPALVQGVLVLAGGYLVGAAVNSIELPGLLGSSLAPFLVGGAVSLVLAWWGPGTEKFRYGTRMLTVPLARSPRTTWVLVGVLLAIGWVMALLWDVWETSWLPADRPPNPFS